MSDFFNTLKEQTKQEQNYLLAAPIIQRVFKGEASLEEYASFLAQAYHHVKHTVPLMMSVGARLIDVQEWQREAVAEYIEEEIGHQEWVLNDIAACGFDKETVRCSQPHFATEMMVSYAYDSIARKNPLSFFGMVHVLEGTSIELADGAASNIANAVGLPKKAFSYLTSHGALDIEHVKFFENLMNQITDEADQQAILHAAKRFYRLYGDIFRGLDDEPFFKARTQGKLALEGYIVGERDDDGDFGLEAYELELCWQLIEQGKLWADWGALFELEKKHNEDVYEATSGFVIEKKFGKTSLTMNAFLVYEWGQDIQNEWESEFRAQYRYRYRSAFQPSIEVYVGEDFVGIGPGFIGLQRFDGQKQLKWEAGFITEVSQSEKTIVLGSH